MSHFTAGCPYPYDQCKCYTARSWSPGAENPEDAHCVNCGMTHGPAVGGSESRVAPGQPADGERSAPPTDLDWMEAVPDGLISDLHAELGLLLSVDGHNDEAVDWLNDIVSTVLRLVGNELLVREAAYDRVLDGLRDSVGRLTRERDEWEANEQEQYREVQRLQAIVDRYDAFFDDAFPDDPYLKGCLDGEWDAFERRGANNGTPAAGAGAEDNGSSGTQS